MGGFLAGVFFFGRGSGFSGWFLVTYPLLVLFFSPKELGRCCRESSLWCGDGSSDRRGRWVGSIDGHLFTCRLGSGENCLKSDPLGFGAKRCNPTF